MSKRRSAKFTFLDRYQPLPADWDTRRLRDLAKIVGGGTPSTDEPSYWDGDVPWLTPTEMNNITGRFATTSERFVSRLAIESSNCQLLPIGSIVITTRGTIGKVAIAGVPLTCNQSCEALLPEDDVNGDFLYYLLSFCQPIIERFGAGTTFMSVTRRDIRDIHFVVPKKPEQEKISEILTSLDDAIDIARQELEKAQRLKTALLQLLFTKGLPGRHGGFQQTKIGQIPEEWKIESLSLAAGGPQCVKTGPFGAQLPPEAFVAKGVRLINITDIADGYLDFQSEAYVREELAKRLQDCRVQVGDLVFSRVASVGRLALMTEKEEGFLISSNCIRLRPGPRFEPRFLLNAFLDSEAVRRQVVAASTGGARPIVTPRFLRKMLIPIAEKDEQIEISGRVEAAMSVIAATRRKFMSLDLLKRSLLQNLLTGHIRPGASTARVMSSYPSRNGVAT